MDELAAEPPTPSAIGEYRIERELAPRRTYLATASAGRRVVLKMLDTDCLLDGQLHPSVRERLARVRELAESGVANLHGVERDGAFTFLVWDYVPGRTLAEAVAAGLSGRELLQVARELVLLVGSLHAAGIVHGAITAGNVIVDADRRVRLTHVSPLLYTDPRHDVHAVISLLEAASEARAGGDGSLAQALATAREQNSPLRDLGGLLAGMSEARDTAVAATPERDVRLETRMRRRALLGAALVAGAGLGAFTTVNWYVSSLGGGVSPTPFDRPSDQGPPAAAAGGGGAAASSRPSSSSLRADLNE